MPEPTLPPPIRDLQPLADFPAETFPPLDRPRAPRTEGLSDLRELDARVERNAVSPRQELKLMSAASGHAVSKRLLGKHFTPIGLRVLDQKAGPRLFVAVFYSYSNQWAVDIEITSTGGFVSANEVRLQPSLTEAEHSAAVRAGAGELGERVGELTAGAIAVSRSDPADPLYERRLADVRFFRPDQRLARFFAIVDVATNQVVSAGPVD